MLFNNEETFSISTNYVLNITMKNVKFAKTHDLTKPTTNNAGPMDVARASKKSIDYEKQRRNTKIIKQGLCLIEWHTLRICRSK